MGKIIEKFPQLLENLPSKERLALLNKLYSELAMSENKDDPKWAARWAGISKNKLINNLSYKKGSTDHKHNITNLTTEELEKRRIINKRFPHV